MTGILVEAAKLGGVKTLAIVDDAYDEPAGEEVSEDAFNQFVQALEAEVALPQELSGLSSFRAADLEDWEAFIERDALLNELWGLHTGTSSKAITDGLKAALGTLFSEINENRIAKLIQLKPLEDLLAEISGVRLMRLGSEPAPDSVASADVVFLDLFLSSELPPAYTAGVTTRGALERAKERALDYLEEVRSSSATALDKAAPAFILISSLGTPRIGDNFRKLARQTASRFRFVSKQSIEQHEPHGLIAIADILSTCQASAVVEPLRKAFPKVLDDAKTWVEEKLIDLDISDFGRLYHLRLQEEGQPVEDYLKELVAGALAERIACGFSQRRQANVGASPFERMPSYFFERPSNAFADLYSATRISLDPGHQRKKRRAPMSGDLYLNASLPKRKSPKLNRRTILTVMSPICDLVSRKGKAPAAKSVLLLPGVLCATPVTNSQEPQTISIAQRFYEIEWDMKHPQALGLSALKAHCRKGEWTWLGRLKAEHFLALQSVYLSTFGRVGLLKPPYRFEGLAGKVCAREGGNLVELGSAFTAKQQLAFESPERPRKKEQPLFFTGAFVDIFVALMKEVAAKQERAEVTRTKADGILKNVEGIRNLLVSQKASKHQITNHLHVNLLEDRTEQPPAAGNGLIHILLWKP